MTENTNYIFEELFKAAQPNRGLFVMPLPTGAGKTYNSCQMMAEELKKEDARRIIYVTDAKKQLDATIEDIEKNLKKNGLKLRSMISYVCTHKRSSGNVPSPTLISV